MKKLARIALRWAKAVLATAGCILAIAWYVIEVTLSEPTENNK